MGVEIERKFLIKLGASLPETDQILNIRQAYLANDNGSAVRVRITNMEEAYLTIKQASQENLGVRKEFEYAIPIEDALEMMQMSAYTEIVKQRHVIMVGEEKWEVDFFMEENEGLIIAEIELPSLDTPLVLPEWVGEEVTDDPRYLNNYLARTPYSMWKE